MKNPCGSQLFLIAIISFLFPNIGLSCSFSGGIPPICSIYSEAEIVFEGVVTDLGEQRTELNESLPSYSVTFSVEKIHKGVAGETILIQAIANMCFEQYEKDKRYLIYASQLTKDRRYAKRTTLLTTVEKTRFLKEEFDFLQSIADGKWVSSIHGFVYEFGSDPMKDVLITIEGNGKIYKTVSRKDGYFFLPEIQPGTYIIRCTVPAPTLIVIDREEIKSKKLQNFNIAEIEVTVKKDGCSYTEFQLYNPENK